MDVTDQTVTINPVLIVTKQTEKKVSPHYQEVKKDLPAASLFSKLSVARKPVRLVR